MLGPLSFSTRLLAFEKIEKKRIQEWTYKRQFFFFTLDVTVTQNRSVMMDVVEAVGALFMSL